jgi:hypothetical protein
MDRRYFDPSAVARASSHGGRGSRSTNAATKLGRLISGNKSVNMELTGFLLPSDEGQELMQRAFDSDQEMMLRVKRLGNDIEEWIVKVTNFTRACQPVSVRNSRHFQGENRGFVHVSVGT